MGCKSRLVRRATEARGRDGRDARDGDSLVDLDPPQGDLVEDALNEPSWTDTLLAAWDDFWFGEYWNQPMAVYVSPGLVIGICLIIYGVEYVIFTAWRQNAIDRIANLPVLSSLPSSDFG